MPLRLFFCSLIAMFLVGCTTIEGYRTGASLYDAKPDDCLIQLYNFPPAKPFEEVGMLLMKGSYDISRYLVRMKSEACKLGGDAILFLQIGNAAATYKTDDNKCTYEGTANPQQDGRAVVIKFN